MQIWGGSCVPIWNWKKRSKRKAAFPRRRLGTQPCAPLATLLFFVNRLAPPGPAAGLNPLARDLRLALRTLGRRPGFTVVCLLVMALGIGANVALFTVVRGVLLKPLPFCDPDRLVMLYEAGLAENNAAGSNLVSGGVFAEWKKQNRSYTSLALAQGIRVGLSASGGQLPEKLKSALVSWDLLRTLGVQPALGRDFL